MSNLPSGWSATTLGEIQTDAAQGIVPSQFPDEQFELFSVPSHPSGTAEVLRGAVIGSNKQTVVPGTVLLCKINPRINRVWVVEPKTDLRTIASTEWIPFWPSAEIDSHYLAYYLRQNVVRDFLAQHASGVGGSLMRVKPSTFSQFPFVLAPRREQDRIVAEIEKQFTRLEAATAALKRVQANLKRYRASILKAACEGRLVPTEAELARKEGRDYEAADKLLQRILRERRVRWEADTLNKMTASGKPPRDDNWKQKYKEPFAPDTTKLPDLPEGWCWASWDQLSNWVTYGFTRPAPHVDEGPPIITARHILGGRINFADFDRTTDELFDSLSEKDKPKKDDILITKDGAIGRAAIVEIDDPFCINQSVAVVWLRSCPCDRRFLLAVIESPWTQKPIEEKARGVAIQHLSITDFAKMALPLAPLLEQCRIGDAVSGQLSVIDKLAQELKTELCRAPRLRQSVLESAFTGRLVAQDSTDEPASVLLERIRNTSISAGKDRGIRRRHVATRETMEVG